MDQLPALGTSAAASVLPTFQIYKAILAPLAPSFLKPVEFSYGPQARQKLDVFVPPEGNGLVPVIIFVHGGGFDKGSKRLPNIEGAYQNVGSYFAHRGFLSIVPNYRLVTPENETSARFPSGGQDVALVLEWLSKNLDKADLSRVFLLGNSAGAVHVATYLFADAIPAIKGTPEEESSVVKSGVAIRAAVLVGMPADFDAADPLRSATLQAYYGGGAEEIAQLCASSLRKYSKDETELLIATSELDPEDEILQPNRRFCEIIKTLSHPQKWETLRIMGHNHFSTPLGLSAGGKEEEWGLHVADWLLARPN